jgi:hypothetical protein
MQMQCNFLLNICSSQQPDNTNTLALVTRKLQATNLYIDKRRLHRILLIAQLFDITLGGEEGGELTELVTRLS